jgi:hypothetical protein
MRLVTTGLQSDERRPPSRPSGVHTGYADMFALISDGPAGPSGQAR